MKRAKVHAPAKINLTLHVTGQRDDGYHLLDSLVVFAPVHDTLDMNFDTSDLSMTVEGPEADGVPTDMANLVLRAADILGEHLAAHLTKNLPPASGMGGGSADAAAVLRALLLRTLPPEATLDDIVAQLLQKIQALELHALGADVPMCMLNMPMHVRGIGEQMTPLGGIPPINALLVNPRRAVSTPEVFRAMTTRDNPPMPEIPTLPDAAALIAFLKDMRNDMQVAAKAIEPSIGDVLTTLERTPGCGLARMSGSGASCFGLFADISDEELAKTAQTIRRAHPDWWVASGPLGNQFSLGLPTFS
ncbi:4-diphosphocytidyl-2-C-methyl-D-erythritol kinase [Sagittula marina]|uniref:4-diphosphocytidyl-2-C-methyl-D-erythritol kinase n=1 Tax=Sagittula marina TaxID=943940 RepID=A0A7W6DQE4_9RHOB|nr:4-(cytidine 5'-diphospho)-2-C-methyl-D-erythritol kinase [Sagittula marina]MBB3986904.1 4-diphosphocytidyl-2-C-methyl-D-erythritol kinase [Sagittula marina]